MNTSGKFRVKQLLTTLFVTAFLIFGGCGGTPAPSGIDELDLAVRDASDYLNENIPEGSKIVILNIQSDSPALSDYIIDELISNAVSDRVFAVVDRQQLDVIRAEQNFQYSGEVDDNSALEIGRFFGAQTIVSGAIGRLGSGHRIRIRALEVQTAQVQGQFNRNISSSPLIADIIASSSSAVRAGSTTAAIQAPAAQTSASSSGVQAQAIPAQAATQTFRVGDIGPAGGIIFYDKGNNSGGWRYLEAAPAEAEFQAIFSIHDSSWQSLASAAPYGTTEDSIGSGRRNTQLIFEKSKQITGEWDTAVQKVVELVFNGFNDWFLPSIDELNQMYGNLKRRNLDEFRNGFYWSSTDIG